jgi:hypothetical protein
VRSWNKLVNVAARELPSIAAPAPLFTFVVLERETPKAGSRNGEAMSRREHAYTLSPGPRRIAIMAHPQ